MPSTTVHLPDELLSQIDNIVKTKEISRNRFIIQACELALKNVAGDWPEGFFDTDISAEDLRILEEGVQEMEQAIVKNRKSRIDTAL